MTRLADGEDRIEMDVRVDERRREKPTLGIDLGPAVGGQRSGRPNGVDAIAIDEDVDGVDRTSVRGMDARVTDEQPGRRHLHLW